MSTLTATTVITAIAFAGSLTVDVLAGLGVAKDVKALDQRGWNLTAGLMLAVWLLVLVL